MLKLLIADDEKLIRETISSLINWTDLNIELIGTAKDGIEAYNIILDQYPDIVLTDIKMPGLSGLDLIERIKDINKETQFIILSGYNEFEYAKTAMQYGVKHYLLKPCSEEQIIKSIELVKAEYYQNRITNHIVEEHKDLKNQLYTNIMIDIINNYLSHDKDENSLIEQSYFTDYHRHFNGVDNSYDIFYLYYIEENNFKEACKSLYTFWNNHYPGVLLNILYVHNTMLFFFPSFSISYEEIESFCKTLHFVKQNTTPYMRHITYSTLPSTLNKITSQIRRYEKIHYTNGHSVTTISNYSNLIKNIQNMTSQLFSSESSSKSVLQSLRDTIFNIYDIYVLKQLSSSIIMTAVSIFPSLGIVNAVEALIHLDDETDLQKYKENLFQSIEDLYTRSNNASSTGEISSKIKKYVEENISNPELSLKWIAENKLYMNVDYISKKFVKETGQRFSTYLTDVRINTAKELLASSDTDKIQNIAELVGCGNNPQYFSQIFKKSTGKTPSSYHKMIQGNQ